MEHVGCVLTCPGPLCTRSRGTLTPVDALYVVAGILSPSALTDWLYTAEDAQVSKRLGMPQQNKVRNATPRLDLPFSGAGKVRRGRYAPTWLSGSACSAERHTKRGATDLRSRSCVSNHGNIASLTLLTQELTWRTYMATQCCS